MDPSETVSITKAYFETLLRKAQFHASGDEFTTPLHSTTVKIPRTEYDSLLNTAREYANLQRNLFKGGIAEETLRILINDDTPTNENGDSTIYSAAEETSDGGAILNQFPQSTSHTVSGKQDYTFGRNANYSNYPPRNGGDYQPRNINGFNNHGHQKDESSYMPDGPDVFYDEDSGNNDSQARSQRPQYDKFCKRTLLISNLPENTTHAEIAEVVKGGMLLDIYLRTHDRAASVSFLHESAAQDFYRHVKRHDLYIKGKRAEIRWNDRQFILPGHVANKIAIGATRNLVIVNKNAKHTEEAIRDDLEHIHNLVVIKVSFSGQNAFISTNSVHNAMFARTCMMSRAAYKGCKIEWDTDECNTPIEKPVFARKENTPPKKKDAPPMNRFHLLNLDGTDDDSQGDTDDLDASGVSLPITLPPGLVV